MNEKITSRHLELVAYVYVRQSTMQQVRHNLEGQRRQYSLADYARQLGFRTVEIVDEDLGRSGSGTVERPGFSRLVTAVCEGKVGAVFALEAARLARNNRDWHHLLEFCTVTETLVVDYDGIYDPRLQNDRLLLGLKGTMAEMELGILRQRAREAFLQKVRRGEVIFNVTVGYVRTEENRLEMIADRQVQTAISGVFRKFRELGSVRQMLLWYGQENLLLPSAVGGGWGKEIAWYPATYTRLLSLLKNPVYAGAFVYGRSRTKTVIKEGCVRRVRGPSVSEKDWQVLIRDHHPGYISWDQYRWNQKQLEVNCMNNWPKRGGAAKRGPALLAGLLRCGRCGRKLHVAYSGLGGRIPRYECRGGEEHYGKDACLSFGGLSVDQAVAEKVLDAVQPVGVEASLEAWERSAWEEDEKQRALRLALERASYDVERARKQYDVADPANRLVAGELEARWEEALRRKAELEARLEAAKAERLELNEHDRERLLELGKDLEALWNHEEANPALKKRLLRAVLEEVVVDAIDEPPQLKLEFHWNGGVHTAMVIPKRRPGQHRWCTDENVLDLVRELVKVCDDQTIASVLNRLGHRTATGFTWKAVRVRSLRSKHGIATFDRGEGRAYLTLTGAATRLGISELTAKRMIKRGILPGRQVASCAPWVVAAKDLDLPRVQAAVQSVREGRGIPRDAPGQLQLPLSQ